MAEEKYLLLSPDGKLSWIKTQRENMLATFKAKIGCEWVEHVSLPHGFGCVVDEMGKVKRVPQPVNPYASRFYPGTYYGDPLVGPVVFVRTGYVDGEPDWVPLTDAQVSLVALILGQEVPAA